ncbi:HNH endonuclease [Achromobacter anxifer]|uniref:HNH endonuclease n=1 Tax=Achromobacter anxifer TaxID=1287737 RepID=UPI0023F67D69|nr:HNH endonuclease [Achromobacter anxifer]MDF8362570.1 HNH endonuclease [Achromobacter anxifer]
MHDLAEKFISLLAAKPISTSAYYGVTLLCNEQGNIELHSQTYWVGYTDDKPPREIRKARIVDAEYLVESWRQIGQTAFIVNNLDEMQLFFLHGGNAIIERTTAEAVVPEWLKPEESVNVGRCGFASPSLLPSTAFNRAPTPKLRMQILKRDNYRCRICGRDPANHTDVELHIHHVRPWSFGGVTEESNLITLCHTCHKGLDPHFEHSLYKLFRRYSHNERQKAYWQGICTYQEKIVKLHEEAS